MTAYADNNDSQVSIVDSGICGKQGDNLTWTLDSNGLLTMQWKKISGNFPTNISVTWHTHTADSKWQSDQDHHWHSCTDSACPIKEDYMQDGYEEHKWNHSLCSVCGHKRDHEHYGFDPVPAKEATCTEAGHDAYYTCSGCDALFKDGVGAFEVSFADLTIPATGHKYDGYLQDAEGHWQKCSVCGEATAKESHSFNGDTCVTCGYQKPETEKAETNTDTETKTEMNTETGTTTTTTRSSGGSHHDSAEVTDNSQKGRWIQDEKGWYFRRNDGSYPKSGWSKLKWLGKEYWYYFDENGIWQQ